MITTEINNQTKYKISRKKLQDVLDLARKQLKIKAEQSLSLAFVSPAQIKKLNKAYRKKDKVTDVLSFAVSVPRSTCSVHGDVCCSDFLGEIIICPAQAKKQAKEFGQSFDKEITKLFLHGYLHLIGYDHVKKQDAVIMEGLEKKILCV